MALLRGRTDVSVLVHFGVSIAHWRYGAFVDCVEALMKLRVACEGFVRTLFCYHTGGYGEVCGRGSSGAVLS